MTETTSVKSLRPKVVYVMGAGRSGSTILGVAMGNCTDVFYAGELDAWLRKAGVPNFGGQRRTQFWDHIRGEMTNEADLFGDQSLRYIEHSSAVFRYRAWRTRRRLRCHYRRMAEGLYLSIMRLTGATHIVDTSHYPLRARELQTLEGIDLYLVYLVRTPENVVTSFSRQDVDQPSKSLLATNLYLYLTHLLSVFVFLRQRPDRRLFLRYEDFVSDPQRLLSELLEYVDAPSTLPDLTSLKTGVAFQGNRLLQSETVAFRSKSEIAPSRQWLTALLQAPWKLVLARLRPSARPHPGVRK